MLVPLLFPDVDAPLPKSPPPEDAVCVAPPKILPPDEVVLAVLLPKSPPPVVLVVPKGEAEEELGVEIPKEKAGALPLSSAMIAVSYCATATIELMELRKAVFPTYCEAVLGCEAVFASSAAAKNALDSLGTARKAYLPNPRKIIQAELSSVQIAREGVRSVVYKIWAGTQVLSCIHFTCYLGQVESIQ